MLDKEYLKQLKEEDYIAWDSLVNDPLLENPSSEYDVICIMVLFIIIVAITGLLDYFFIINIFWQMDTESIDQVKSKLSLFKRIRTVFVDIAVLMIQMVLIEEKYKYNKKYREVRGKLKYFNPVLKEGFFFKSITWVGREKPLTDEELNILMPPK